MKQYNERDIMVLDEIGNYYSNHASTMTDTTKTRRHKRDIS